MRRATIVLGMVAVLVTAGTPARAQLVGDGASTDPVESPLTIPTLPLGPVVSTVSTLLSDPAPPAPAPADPAEATAPIPTGAPAVSVEQPTPARRPAQPGGEAEAQRPGAGARTPAARPAGQTPPPGSGPLQPRLLSAARTTAAEFSVTGVLAAMVGLILLGHGAARRKSAALDDSPIDDRDGVVRFG